MLVRAIEDMFASYRKRLHSPCKPAFIVARTNAVGHKYLAGFDGEIGASSSARRRNEAFDGEIAMRTQ